MDHLFHRAFLCAGEVNYSQGGLALFGLTIFGLPLRGDISGLLLPGLSELGQTQHSILILIRISQLGARRCITHEPPLLLHHLLSLVAEENQMPVIA